LFERVGISAREAAAAQEKALGNLRAGFDTSIDDQILALTDPMALFVRQWKREKAEKIRDARAIGADIDDVIRLYGLKWKEAMKQFGQSAVDAAAEQRALVEQRRQAATERATGAVVNLQGYLRELQFGDASGLTAAQQLRLATSQYNAVSGAAKAGNIGSIEQFQGAASTYLAELRDRYGSGAGYAAGFQRVVDDIARIAALPPDRLTLSAYRDETRTQTQALVSEIRELRAEVGRLRQQVQQGGSAPNRMVA
jgi:hypothetical protein